MDCTIINAEGIQIQSDFWMYMYCMFIWTIKYDGPEYI